MKFEDHNVRIHNRSFNLKPHSSTDKRKCFIDLCYIEGYKPRTFIKQLENTRILILRLNQNPRMKK